MERGGVGRGSEKGAGTGEGQRGSRVDERIRRGRKMQGGGRC